ncbi:expressed unknown protein [Seminavis robusta]|uniref:Uncharacterized protein n=1 Tax=Seminavis robusta TaxID=568900 RepID=A0A9N8ESJ5_9STRA|nr:expressed unknown protein [Seminavis robusta]|eukprot:Sro1573_g283410.1 n/a (325) ;mRNA; f:4163-5137
MNLIISLFLLSFVPFATEGGPVAKSFAVDDPSCMGVIGAVDVDLNNNRSDWTTTDTKHNASCSAQETDDQFWSELHQNLLDWRFPGHPCEPEHEQGLQAQPMSACVGVLLSCYLFVKFVMGVHNQRPTAICLAVLALFAENTVHMLAHTVGTLDSRSSWTVAQLARGECTHVFHYIMTLATACGLGNQVGHPKSKAWKLVFLVTAILDLVLFLQFGISFYSMVCGILMTAIVYAGYYPRLDATSKARIWSLTLLSTTLTPLAFANESLNCEYMVSLLAPVAPHCLIEIFLTTPTFWALEKLVTESHAETNYDKSDSYREGSLRS